PQGSSPLLLNEAAEPSTSSTPSESTGSPPTAGGTTIVSPVGGTAGPTPEAPLAPPVSTDVSVLTYATLAPIVQEAKARCVAVGLTPDQAAAVSSATVTIGELGGTYLGLAYAHDITLDNDAA